MPRIISIEKNPERHGGTASRFRDFILGWQDGLVNVLGVVLGVATATNNFSVVLIAAMAAAFAESVSMAAVAYTSFKAENQFYQAEVEREKREMRELPEKERQEIHDIYHNLGFRGSLLVKIVKHVVSNKKRWLKVMMEEELRLFPSKVSPANIAVVVGLSALLGSFIPVIPFFLMSIGSAMIASIIISTAVLFLVGAYKNKTTSQNILKGGVELAAIGMLAALVGYAIGALMGAAVVG